MADKPKRQDLLDELARLFADEVREILQRAEKKSAAEPQASAAANSSNEGR
jgi:hypothetical protein